jgi:plastocyanin
MKLRALKDDQTTLALLAIALAMLALWAIGCGGGGGGAYAPPTNPTPTPAPSGGGAGGSITVDIVSNSGSGAFSPNPVQVTSGGTINWKNDTGATHTLVMNDGRSIGTVAGNGSMTTTFTGAGGNFHCTIHPTMVGSINGTSAPPDPTPNNSGGYDY